MPDSAGIIPAPDSRALLEDRAAVPAEERVEAVAEVVEAEAVDAEEEAEGVAARIKIVAALTTANSRASAIGGERARNIPARFSLT